MLNDLRYAFHGLNHARRLTITLILTIALGVGASLALYSAASALLFGSPGGVRQPTRLLDVYTSTFSGSTYGPFSYADFVDLRSNNRSFQGLAAFEEGPPSSMRFAGVLGSERYAVVSEDFFSVLGLDAHIGSLFSPVTPATPQNEAVISFELWRSAGASAAVLRQPLHLNGQDYTVIGVTPPEFTSLHLGRSPDAWLPLRARVDAAKRGDRRLRVVGRLRDQVTLQAAQEELGALTTAFADRYPDSNRGTQSSADDPRRFTAVRYSRLESAARPHASLVGSILLTGTALALLTACVNASSLLLARGIARRAEFAVKLALGAGRLRLARVLVFECVMIASVGSALGLLMSYWLSTTLPAFLSPASDALIDIRPTVTTALWLLVAATGTGAAVGLVPAVGATGFSLVHGLGLNGGAVGDPTAHGLRNLLLAAQVMLSTVMLIGAALLIGGLSHAVQANYTFAPRRAVLLTVESPGRFANAQQGTLYQAAAMKQLSRVAGVTAVGATATLPLSPANRRYFALSSGRPDVTETIEAGINYVSAGYFRALSVPVIVGRSFAARDDTADSRSVVVNEAFARRYLGRNAADSQLRDPQGPLEIVGVVRNEMHRALLRDSADPMVYYPLRREYAPRVHLVARTASDAADYLSRLRQELGTVEGGAVVALKSVDTHLSEMLVEERIAAMLVAACGTSALCLTVLGVYGLSIEGVRRRTREIGLRIALGAHPLAIVRLVSATALCVAAAGACAGVVSALVMVRVVRWIVYMPAVDITTVFAVAVLLIAIVGASAVIPSWRALQVDPLPALRYGLSYTRSGRLR